jgi:transcription initiation factor TFIIIB Brf1 subunit/transcription initiation factor TFIIB
LLSYIFGREEKFNIHNVEAQIDYLTETITYILKYYAEQEGLPSDVADKVAEEATNLFLKYYRQKRRKGKPIGRSLESLAKSAVLLAIRRIGIPIRNNKATFRLLKSVGGEVPYSPVPYIEWLSHKLGLSKETMEKACEIAKTYRAKTFKRGAPRVVASAVIYIASLMTGERKTQGEIAKIAQCTEVSIRNNYKDIMKKLGLSFTDLAI